MSDQPKPSTGEWTPRDVYRLYRNKTYKQIADAHNAALNDEREKVQSLHDYCHELETKLAQEREKVKTLVDALNRLVKSTRKHIQISESVAMNETEEDWIELRQSVSHADDALAKVGK